MTRTHGGARAVRVIERVPHGHWLTTTMISAVRTPNKVVAVENAGQTV